MREEIDQEIRKIVSPGDILGVVEEFFAGENVYERNGFLISSVAGIEHVDLRDRIVSVTPFRELRKFVPGAFVYVLVTGTRGDIATARVLGFDLVNIYRNNIFGILHVSHIPSERRLRSVDEMIRVGDILYVKIVSRTQPFFLSLRSPKASITVSLCPRCGSIMGRLKEKLVCPSCGYSEERKPITHYLYKYSELRGRQR